MKTESPSLYFVGALFIAVLFSVFLGIDADSFEAKINFDTEAKLVWIAKELGVDPASVSKPTATILLPQIELEDAFVDVDSSDADSVEKRRFVLMIFKYMRQTLSGFYDPIRGRVYLSNKAGDKVYVHELTHHVFNLSLRKGGVSSLRELEKVAIDNEEEIAETVATRYMAGRRWSWKIRDMVSDP